ncbi:MAG: tetratricopeptide repeat protein, partial [Anaerolineae bacterium]
MNDDIQALLDRIAAGSHTEADLVTLRGVLLVGGQGNVIQVGKYNIHIGEGQDIRIGDTVYQGPDAAAIQAALRAVLD